MFCNTSSYIYPDTLTVNGAHNNQEGQSSAEDIEFVGEDNSESEGEAEAIDYMDSSDEDDEVGGANDIPCDLQLDREENSSSNSGKSWCVQQRA